MMYINRKKILSHIYSGMAKQDHFYIYEQNRRCIYND